MKCAVCQEDFQDEEDIVVFSCDPQHYFHKECGLAWLDIKTECPLCKTNFEEEIMRHVMKNQQKGEVDPQDDGQEPVVSEIEEQNDDHADEIAALRTQQMEEQKALQQLLQNIEELH